MSKDARAAWPEPLAAQLARRLAGVALLERTPDQLVEYAKWVCGSAGDPYGGIGRMERARYVLRNALHCDAQFGLAVRDLTAPGPHAWSAVVDTPGPDDGPSDGSSDTTARGGGK